jgi:TolB-like protein
MRRRACASDSASAVASIALALLLLLSPWPLEAAAPPTAARPLTVAVAYFDNNTGSADLAPLGKGLADMIITDLAGLPSLQIVEREKLNQVLAELKLGKSRFVDPKTAQQLGRGLAAAYILTGGYTLAGETLRLDCRIVEVATAKVVGGDKVEGKKQDFFALEKDLVQLLLDTLHVKVGAADRSRLRRNQTQSFVAFGRYAAGLDAQDQGDADKARALFQAALEADPNYTSARNATERLKAIFERTDRQKAEALDRTWAALDPKDPGFGKQVDDLLAGYDSSEAPELRKKVALLRWLAERDLTPSANGFSRAALEILGLLSRYLTDPTQAAVIPAVCEYVVTRFPDYAGGQPQCKAYLKAIDAMAKARAEHPDAMKQPSWQERRKAARLDWEIALLDTEAETIKLFALYARKVRR